MLCLKQRPLSRKQLIIELAKTSALILSFSLVIALITQKIWGGSFELNLYIALVFGLAGSSSYSLLIWRFPRLKPLWQVSLSMLFTLTIGIANVTWSVSTTAQFATSAFIEFSLASLLFCSVVFYFFISRERAIEMQIKLHKAELTQAEIKHQATLSQLQSLQSQIEPHFLFNTLANLKALIQEDPLKAEQLLDKFTELMRINIYKSRANSISIKDELNNLQSYLEIQQIRLGSRLQFQISLGSDIDPSTPMPPQLLQPLVENAVYHGIEPKVKGGYVKIKVELKQQRLRFLIIDNGMGLEQTKLKQTGHGLALNNIRQRINLLFSEQALLEITENHNGGVCATLEIPCEL